MGFTEGALRGKYAYGILKLCRAAEIRKGGTADEAQMELQSSASNVSNFPLAAGLGLD